MNINKLLQEKISELELFIKKADKANWDDNVDFEWKGVNMHIDGYEWMTGGNDTYDGKLLGLKEFQKQITN